jgi:cytochrome b pre-mRNA-processing protein 3
MQLFRRTPRTHTIASLYGTIVAQARAEPFYQDYGVPDTVNGRFEMVVLHMVLLLQRMKAGPGLASAGQAVFDLFCHDMDANLREMGVGDLSVPRKMRRIGEAFYGRQAAYEAALAEAGSGTVEPLVAALARNVFEVEEGDAAGAGHLAAYVQGVARALAAQPDEAIARCEIHFPDPGKTGQAAAGR